MTVEILAEQVIAMLNAGETTNDSRYDLREVMLAIRQNLDAAIVDKLFNSKEYAMIPPSYLSTTEVLMVREGGSLGDFAELNLRPLPLPNNRGVYEVWVDGVRRKPLLPFPGSFNMLYNGTDAARVGNVRGWELEDNRLIVHNLTQDEKDRGLRARLVATTIDFDDTEELAVPRELQDLVVRRVLDLYKPTDAQQPDELNDNVAQT